MIKLFGFLLTIGVEYGILTIVFEVWLSLVERYVRDVEVVGSNPVTSTITMKERLVLSFFASPICVDYPWYLCYNELFHHRS